MKAKLQLCLFLTATFATGLLMYAPLRANGPCFEVADMWASHAMRKLHGKRPRRCESCECNRGQDCPCDYVIVNTTLNTRIPTARYCRNNGRRCADDFDLVRKPDGTIQQTRIGQVRACAIECRSIRIGGKYFIHRCTPDAEADVQNVYASHYVLTGKPCPNG